MCKMLATVNISQLGLTFPEGTPVEQWEQTGDKLRAIARNIQWQWGDLLNYGESRYGEKYKRAVEKWGLNLNTAQQYARVARAFPPCNRLQVSWTHHHAVAGVDDDTDRQKLLIAAMDDGWSVSRLKDEIKNRSKPRIVPLSERRLAVPDINNILPLYPQFTGLHPICEIMPAMTEREFYYLVQGIREDGLRNDIIRCQEGMLVDGKHRLMACHITDREIRIQDLYENEDPIAVGWGMNMNRTHLDPEQSEQLELMRYDLEQKIAAGEVAR